MSNKIVISSGHGLYVRGAAKVIDEVQEARRVVDRVHAILTSGGLDAVKFHENTAKTQTQNLKNITAFHNKQQRLLDVSVHFNAASYTTGARGCEVLHYDATNKTKAVNVSRAISKASGLNDRGAKVRTNLAFLRDTNRPALLIEICFVDSEVDARLYKANFEAICQAIAEELAEIVGQPLRQKTAVEASTRYFIKTGTFDTKAQAETVIAKIKQLKLVSVASVFEDKKNNKYFVRTGTFSDKQTADTVLTIMKNNRLVKVGYVLAA